MIMADNYHNTNIPGSNPGSQSSSMDTHINDMNFEVADFLEFMNWVEDGPAFSSSSPADYNNLQNPVYANNNELVVNSSAIVATANFRERSAANNRDGGNGREKKEIREKVAFKTKSDVEILDDGFKWRKYGKKMVKNRKYPRNYYKCSDERCPVKKRVERDNDDSRYVVTTYEGIHNHQGPMH